MPVRTTAGFASLVSTLPPEYRKGDLRFDQSTLKDLLTKISIDYPQIYPQLVKNFIELSKIGMAYSAGFTFGLEELAPTKSYEKYSKSARELLLRLGEKFPSLTKEEIGDMLISLVEKYYPQLEEELEQKDNNIYKIVKSKVTGNPAFLKRILLSEAYPDSYGNIVPYPVLNNFSKGLSPMEYWAAGYGSKQGIVLTKLAPGEAGSIYKQMVQATNRLLVTKFDGADKGIMRAMPVPFDDEDNIGAVLAQGVAGIPAGTVITEEIMEKLKSRLRKGTRILVRSVIAGGPAEGVYAKAVGQRGGSFPAIGTIVGLEASQALGERIAQLSVGKKHMGVLAGGIGSLTDLLDKLINVPERFAGAATHAQVDGVVSQITKAPGGGKLVMISGQQHYVPEGAELKVKVGSRVEAGDILSDGLPNMREIVEKKGIGEARKIFTDIFTDLYRSLGIAVHRRNVEILARGLINYVRFDVRYGDFLPGDIVDYAALEHSWRPRKGSKETDVSSAKGKYLEVPVLHYTIGTRITNSVINTLKEFGIKKIVVHDEPPPFSPVMVRALDILRYDPDFLVRFLGAYQKRILYDTAALGAKSLLYETTSFVPALAEGQYFGKKWP